MRSLGPGTRTRRAALALLLIALADLAWTTILLPRATHSRERAAAELPASSGAALVLAASVRPGQPNRVVEGRLQAALDLLRAGKVRWLLVSGADHEAVFMQRWLEQRGVASSEIVTDASAHRTYESLQRARTAYGLDDVVVVTSDFHLPRALWLAEHLGLHAVGVPAATTRFGLRTRVSLQVREYAARNRALLDVIWPP